MSDEPLFAIVIPTYNAERHLGTLLESIRVQTCTSYKIAVVDQSSDDRTAEIAGSNGCVVINIPKPRFYSPPGRCRNIGAASVDGHILLHLDADMELGAPDLLMRLGAMIDGSHRAAIIHEVDVALGFWSKCKALERSCYRGTPMEAARAVTRELFDEVGGYDEAISSGEDFYITRLYERETKIIRSDTLTLWHHTERSSLGALLTKKLVYGRTAGTYLVRARDVRANSESQIIQASLSAYFKNWRLLAKYPLHYGCMFPLRVLEFIATRYGMWIESRAEASRRRQSSP